MQLTKEFEKAGADQEGQVTVDISYDIVKHVSAQLYTSPRKAVEELVCNAYDAGAGQCHVRVPEDASAPLLVLDNGESMDLAGLQGLWKVAQSPKVKSDATGEPRIRGSRMQIGKFGVGKLAAYALGRRLTHVACKQGTVRIVSVGENDIKQKKSGAPSFEARRLPLAKARLVLAPVFKDLPKPWDLGWQTWTLAVVDEVEPGNVAASLHVGVLERMIRTALPVSKTFQVYLQGKQVPKRKLDADKIAFEVDVTDAEYRKQLRDALKAHWGEELAIKEEAVDPAKYALSVEKTLDPQNIEKHVNALHVPGLGPVIGKATYAKTSLMTEKLHSRGYSDNGFALTAYGKLVNPEDPLFGITQRAHKYWTRFIANIEIPALDRVLLVQRNAVSESTPEAAITRVVLTTLFNYVRGKADVLEDKESGYKPPAFGERLLQGSPLKAGAAVQGLGMKAGASVEDLGVAFATQGVAAMPARYDVDAHEIQVNEEHPLMAALVDLDAVSSPLHRLLGEVIASIELAKGYLKTRAVAPEIVADLTELLDAALRGAAAYVRDQVEEHIKQIERASHIGGTEFEMAVVDAFRSLRLAAQHIGGPDMPDGIIEIPVAGQPNRRISVEAKGTKGVISHTELSAATVDRHNQDTNCTDGFAIARVYQESGLGGDSALLRETAGKVPLVTVDALATMLRLHKKRPFTYDKVIKILTTWKHPADTESFIRDVWKEAPPTGLIRLVLEVAHEAIEEDAVNFPTHSSIAADRRLRKQKIPDGVVLKVLESVALATGMVTFIDPTVKTFSMNAPVETILEAMQAEYAVDEKAPKK